MRNGSRGSGFVVQRGLTAARRDAAVHEAGNGHERSFAKKNKAPHSGGAAYRCSNKLMTATSVSEVKIG